MGSPGLECRELYQASTPRYLTYFSIARMTGERLFPVKCEDFRDFFVAVHESGHGPFETSSLVRYMVAIGVKRTPLGWLMWTAAE